MQFIIKYRFALLSIFPILFYSYYAFYVHRYRKIAIVHRYVFFVKLRVLFFSFFYPQISKAASKQRCDLCGLFVILPILLFTTEIQDRYRATLCLIY